jgi:hypothetical protein
LKQNDAPRSQNLPDAKKDGPVPFSQKDAAAEAGMSRISAIVVCSPKQNPLYHVDRTGLIWLRGHATALICSYPQLI